MQASVAQLEEEKRQLIYEKWVQVNSIEKELQQERRVCDGLRKENHGLIKENRKLRSDNAQNTSQLQNFQTLTQMVQNQLATLRGHIQNLQTQNEQLARENRTLRQMHGG